MRFFDEEEGKKALELAKRVIQLTAEAHECSAAFAPVFDIAGKPVMNDPALANLAQAGIAELMPGALVHDVTWFASESFNKYIRIAPTLFAFVGMKDDEYGSGAEHHNNYFDVDDAALKHGVLATAKFAVDFLTET